MIKRALRFLKYIFKAFSNSKKSKASFRSALGIFKEFGWTGLIKAIKNKASGRALLEGIINKDEDEPELSYTGSIIISGDVVGRKIFQSQQEDLIEATERTTENLQKHLSFCIILFINCEETELVQQTLRSVRSQINERWGLWTIGSVACEQILAEKNANDSRIHFETISQDEDEAECFNRIIREALCDYVILMRAGDQVTPDALFWVANELEREGTPDLLYSDECCIDRKGNQYRFFFKPAWSPLLTVGATYPGNLSAFRKEAIMKFGGLSKDINVSPDCEMSLRISEMNGFIKHIERVLYCTYIYENTAETFQQQMSARAVALYQHTQRVRYPVAVYNRDGKNHMSNWRKVTPMASLIIPIDDHTEIINKLPNIFRDTAYPNYEVVIVTTPESAEKTRDMTCGLGARLVLCPYKGPDSHACKFNAGAEAAHGEYFIFMRKDIYAAQRDWLSQLVDVLDFPGIGAASPAVIDSEGKVVYGGGRVGQHDGQLYEVTFTGQPFYYSNSDQRALTLQTCREMSVLSKYCFSIKKEVFNTIGGFNTYDTPNHFSELEYSLRIRNWDFHCAYIPTSVFFIEEIEREKPCPRDRSYIYMMKKWHKALIKDHLFTESMLKYSLNCASLPDRLMLPEKMPGGEKGNVLLISHELSRTGTPQVMFEAAKALKEQGYFPVIASPENGPLSTDIYAEGIPVVIDQELGKYRAYKTNDVPEGISPGIDNFLRSFDLVMVASIVGHNLINCYNGSDIRFLWWMHEGWMGFDLLKSYMPSSLQDNISVYCGGKYAQKMTKKYFPQYNPEVLLYGVKDRFDQSEISVYCEKTLFLFPATFERRKNQMLLLEAVGMLPPSLAEKADFLLIGKTGEEIYHRRLVREADKLPNVTVTGPVPFTRLMDIYRETACVIVASIDDPMPVVLAEAMMMHKVILCSDMTGTASYIEDGKNGFVFSCKSASELKGKLVHIIEDFDKMDEVRKAGRTTYEQYFSQEIFTRNLIAAVEANINRFEEDTNCTNS